MGFGGKGGSGHSAPLGVSVLRLGKLPAFQSAIRSLIFASDNQCDRDGEIDERGNGCPCFRSSISGVKVRIGQLPYHTPST